MGRTTGSATLNAGTKKVWEFITNPRNFPEYVNGYADGTVLTENSTGLGSAFEWYGELGPIRLKSKEEVVEWNENERVAYTGTMFGVKFDSSMTLQKAESGKTSLTVDVKYKVPFIMGGRIMDKLLLKWITRDYVDRSLEKLEEIFG